MRRADRLFQIVQMLRRRKVVTAQRMADELQVSERTIYRDIQDLVLSGVPIDGEAGIGYLLRGEYDLPPLMFNSDELQALVLGARMVRGWADPVLHRAAGSALDKIEHVLPDHLKPELSTQALLVPDFHVSPAIAANMGPVREAIDQQRKIALDYTSANGTATNRTVRPLTLVFWGSTWTLGAWCELRKDFRTFRIDRMKMIDVLQDEFEQEPGKSLKDFLRRVEGE
jgi:predicted DNA-binding transcriptional regulator YafY